MVKPGERKTLLAKVELKEKKLLEGGCKRAVLRGAPVAGDGARALRSALGTAFAECQEAVKRDNIALDAALRPAEVSKTWPVRELRRVSLPLAKGLPAAVLTACAPQLQALRKAIQHGQACAPWSGKGWSNRPESLVHHLRLAEVATVQAVQAWNAKKVAEAFALVTDQVRLSQDLGRRGPLIEAVIGLAAGLAPLLALEAMLNQGKAKVSAEALTQLDKELTILLASEPDISSVFLAEHIGMLLHEPLTMGEFSGRDKEIADKETSKTLIIVSLERQMVRVQKACPTGSSATACVEGLEAMEKAVLDGGTGGDPATKGPSIAKLLADFKKTGTDPSVRREKILKIIGETSLPRFSKYARQLARRPFLLAAAKLHVGLRLKMLAKQTSCPDEKASQPFADLAGLTKDPTTGKAFAIKHHNDGRWLISSDLASPKEAAKYHYQLYCAK